MLYLVARRFIRSSVLYDYSEDKPEYDVEENELVDTIKQLCQLTNDDIRPEAANLVTRLHSLLSRVPPYGPSGAPSFVLYDIYKKMEQGEICPSKKTKFVK